MTKEEKDLAREVFVSMAALQGHSDAEDVAKRSINFARIFYSTLHYICSYE